MPLLQQSGIDAVFLQFLHHPVRRNIHQRAFVVKFPVNLGDAILYRFYQKGNAFEIIRDVRDKMRVINRKYRDLPVVGILEPENTERRGRRYVNDIGFYFIEELCYPFALQPWERRAVRNIERNGNGGDFYNPVFRFFFGRYAANESIFKPIVRYPPDKLIHGLYSAIVIFGKNIRKKNHFDFPFKRTFFFFND